MSNENQNVLKELVKMIKILTKSVKWKKYSADGLIVALLYDWLDLNMLNFLLYYVMLHVDAGDNPARHCHLGPGRHLYAVFVLICLACFMMCIFLCCILFSCFNIDVSVFIFGKKLCRAYVIMLYTCRIKIKFSYLILILSYLFIST